jgi:NAD(P)H dehydrogenase (quinone)
MRAALNGIDTVVMISAPVAAGGERVGLHRNVIAAARQSGVQRILFTSVIGNGREMDTMFGATQQVNRQTEADLQNSGLEWLIGRNGLYLELDLIQMRKAGESGVYANSAGEGRCPYLSIGEIACAYASWRLTGARRARSTTSAAKPCRRRDLRLACEVFRFSARYETISDEACVAKFRALMPERGEAVARMLTGCFQSIRAGAFDVPSHFREATGRPAKSVREMMLEIAASQN